MQGAATVLAELSSARTPWLALALAGPAALSRLEAAGDVTVIDITDPQAVPVMVNPFEPAPGYPVQAHADRLAGLFEASFGLGEPVAGALRAGLRRAYADCGWDMLTGAARPGAVSPPGVPAFRQLKLATVAAARDLGFDPGMRAGVRGLVEARLDALWAGAAGLFLEGGHPASVARLLRGNVLVTGRGLADETAASFLAGVLLLRLAEQLGHRAARPGAPAGQAGGPDDRDPAGGSRPVIVVGLSSRGTARFGRLLEDLRLGGADVVLAAAAGEPASGQAPGTKAPAGQGPADQGPADQGPAGPAVRARRSGPGRRGTDRRPGGDHAAGRA